MISEIFHRITFVEIVYATVMFIIIRFIIWCLRQAERVGETELKRAIHSHVHGRHGGHYRKCGQCTTDIAISDIDLAL